MLLVELTTKVTNLFKGKIKMKNIIIIENVNKCKHLTIILHTDYF